MCELLDKDTESQLKILDEVSIITEELEIEFWLRGGWAIDFLLGKINRRHEDIDLVTWVQNRESLEKALIKSGFEQVPVREQYRDRQSDFRKDDVEVTFGYITHSSNGSLIMNGLPEWLWMSDSLLSKRFKLHGKSAKVLNPKQLLKEKEVYEQIGRTPRSKDIESKKILQGIISDLGL